MAADRPGELASAFDALLEGNRRKLDKLIGASPGRPARSPSGARPAPEAGATTRIEGTVDGIPFVARLVAPRSGAE
ncbi:MAG: hypothetical protein U1F68_10155 [Gammaproteobacteria bacterium]